MKRLYFDYASTTPLSKEVTKAMKPFITPGISGAFGNPSAIHTFGQGALQALDGARADVGRALKLPYDFIREVIFTGSATEANNLAIRGAVRAFKEHHKKQRPKILISAVEHESVFETVRDMSEDGLVDFVLIPVDKKGAIDYVFLKKELDERTALVSVMYVNNETGTMQPISKIAEIIRKFRNSKSQSSNNKQISSFNKKNKKSDISDLENSDLFGNWKPARPGGGLEIGNYAARYPLLHCDAVQAFQYFDCAPETLGVDMLTLSAHKMYGPKGVGMLYVKNHQLEKNGQSQKNIFPIITGGMQEFGVRAGTENVANIVGFAKSIEEAVNAREKQAKKMRILKRGMFRAIQEVYPRVEINGDILEKGSPHILNVWLPGIPNELLLIQLDLEGVAVSAGSACRARVPEPSRVLTKMYTLERAKESIRFSFGKYLKNSDVAIFAEKFRDIIGRYKA